MFFSIVCLIFFFFFNCKFELKIFQQHNTTVAENKHILTVHNVEKQLEMVYTLLINGEWKNRKQTRTLMTESLLSWQATIMLDSIANNIM